MKIRGPHILLIAVALGAGVAFSYWCVLPHRLVPEDVLVEVPQAASLNEEKRPVLPKPQPVPVVEKVISQVPVMATEPHLEEQATDPIETAKQRRVAEYWKRMGARFEQLEAGLSGESNLARRAGLIREMAGYVRVDTPRAIDWAMSLVDPVEKRAALEAINKNALVGIGAQIKVDETGLPKIMDTTLLSAIASTGMAAAGDYISGMVTEDGSTIYFKDRPVRQIVQFLRGQPGTEIQLLMERVPTEGHAKPYSFDVAVQRSMIIVHPPF
jgi:C-terminal processing protease CtpA/Prc